jgi:ribosomal protein S18 acetylase RimI-like enzyme
MRSKVCMELMTQFDLREAAGTDVGAIVSLINRAFAVERFFKNGDRTNSQQVQQLMQEGKFLLLTGKDGIAACIFVKIAGERAYLGTLSVDPALQRLGLGSLMMQQAEEYCRAADCKVLDIRIVNVRTELPEIYRKFGFVETGTQSAEMINNASRPIHFVTMSKKLA